jgi:mycothiol synthase
MYWKIRPYEASDTEVLAATETASFQADALDIVTSPEEVVTNFSRLGVDLQRGIIIVDGPRVEGLPEGILPGFGYLGIREDDVSNERRYHLRISVHPAARPLGLERELVLRLVKMARANEKRPALVPRQTISARENISPRQATQKQLFEAIGMKALRTFWIMKCPLGNLPEPEPVEGVRIRPLQLPEDTIASMDSLNGSFIDHYDFHPQSEDRWVERLNRPFFRPDLSWVGEIEAEPGKLAGFCLCGIFEEENEVLGRSEGWVETLGTIRGWRGKGLGRSLLLHGLHSLEGVGLDTGVLGVDAENPTGATRLYESVGFHVHDGWMEYGCALDEINTATL